jgi:hypothetical protein
MQVCVEEPTKRDAYTSRACAPPEPPISSAASVAKPSIVGCFPSMSRWFKRPDPPSADEKENLALPAHATSATSVHRSSIVSVTRRSSITAPPTPASTEDEYPLTSPSQESDSDPVHLLDTYDDSLVPPGTPALSSPNRSVTSLSSAKAQPTGTFEAFVYRGAFALDPEDPLLEPPPATSDPGKEQQGSTGKSKRSGKGTLTQGKRARVTSTVENGQFTLKHFAYNQSSL